MTSLIITAINVFILFFAVGYFLSDTISNMLAKRKNGIVESIESAKSNKLSAIENKAEYEYKINNFNIEEKEILDNTHIKAKRNENDILGSAEAEVTRIINRANKEAELKMLKIKDEVKQDMITCATKVAMKLINETIDQDKQAALIEQTLSEMGESTWQD